MTPLPPIRIAPSLLSVDFSRMAEGLALVERGGADLHHVDVMDGHFVPNLSIGPPVVKCVAKSAKIPLDCHLMVTDPVTYGERFAALRGNLDMGVTFHVEVVQDVAAAAAALRKAGVRPGIAINPPTPVEMLEPALEHVEMVLVMSVHPGFGGQKFIADVLGKVEALRGRYGWTKDIEMDGGIDRRTIASCVAAGANVLVAGTAIYGAADPAAEVGELRRLAEAARR
ncbi:MAG: Ribulose-phosphate 3-epimerase [Planctomycetes bacterium]|nr:Ribulose-phosphate 3-epimerase [Planctomycetota bacterium]